MILNKQHERCRFSFHAAALKQVPSCEFYPYQATLTNIIGSNNVSRAAIENNVSKSCNVKY